MPFGGPQVFRVFGDPAGGVSNSAGPASAGANLFGSESVSIGVDAAGSAGTDPTIQADGGIAIGARAAQRIQASEYVVIGRDAAPDALEGTGGTGNDGLIAIGPRALQDYGSSGNQTGQQNMLAIGSDALAALDGNNVFNALAIGANAAAATGAGATIARNFVVVGHDAVSVITNTLQESVVIGNSAGKGGGVFGNLSSSVVIGHQAVDGYTSTLSQEVIIGHNAGRSLTSGTQNTGVGASVLQNLTTGQANTAMGVGAGIGLSTQGQNVHIGAGAAGAATAQTILGESAGQNATTKSGAVVIGRLAGRTNVLATHPFVLESAVSGGGGATRPVPFLYGDMTNANLLLGQHVNGSNDPIDRVFPTAVGPAAGGPVFCVQDSVAASGGVAPIANGGAGMVGIWYDSGAGVAGELRAIDPAGTIRTLAAF